VRLSVKKNTQNLYKKKHSGNFGFLRYHCAFFYISFVCFFLRITALCSDRMLAWKYKSIFFKLYCYFQKVPCKISRKTDPLKKTLKFCKNAFVWEKKLGYFDFKLLYFRFGKEKNEKTMERRKKKKRKNFWLNFFPSIFF
jgi:hypothetical protein